MVRHKLSNHLLRLGFTDERRAALKAGCAEYAKDESIAHTKNCDSCAKTMVDSDLFGVPEILRFASLERVYRVAEPGTAGLRFSDYRPCDDCGAEIYGTRQLGEQGAFWANRLDNRLHSCTDFQGAPDVVEPWTPQPKNRTSRDRRSKGWR